MSTRDKDMYYTEQKMSGTKHHDESILALENNTMAYKYLKIYKENKFSGTSKNIQRIQMEHNLNAF